MKLRYELIGRNVAGEDYLIPIGETLRRYNGMFTLSPTAAFLWANLEQAQSAGALTRLLWEEVEVEWEKAAADTAEFLACLREMELME